jgi:nucleotide-binding universal stress UspA family protein
MIPRKILVGVETADCLPALQVAAQEAARRRCGVHLLHGLPPVYASHPRIEELELVAGELQRAGTVVVGDAARALEQLMPEDLLVSTELCHGAVVSSLVEVSAHACLVVLHQRHEHRHLLSTIQAVAARAQCPVLIVPRTWHQEGAADEQWVVAGVQDASRSARVVEAALAEASRRHVRLRLVHGLEDHDERTDDMGSAARDALLRLRHRTLEADLSDLCATRTDVAVELVVVPQAPAASLVAQAPGTAVIVIGRGHSKLPFVRRPGQVTAEVLGHATCPVLVVDEEPPGPAPRRRELAQVAVP